MPDLTRRLILGAATFLAAAPKARADDPPNELIDIGIHKFSVPKPYLFNEIMPPGVSPDGLPPYFSFAFLMPDGAPCGFETEFPPITHPYVLEREGGRYPVMCYRVASPVGVDGHRPIRPPAHDQLNSSLLATDIYDFSAKDGQLALSFKGQKDNVDSRFASDVDRETDVVTEIFLIQVDRNAQFFYGACNICIRSNPLASFVLYIPAVKIAYAMKCAKKAANFLMNWKI